MASAATLCSQLCRSAILPCSCGNPFLCWLGPVLYQIKTCWPVSLMLGLSLASMQSHCPPVRIQAASGCHLFVVSSYSSQDAQDCVACQVGPQLLIAGLAFSAAWNHFIGDQ